MPSSAATASLSIAEKVANFGEERNLNLTREAWYAVIPDGIPAPLSSRQSHCHGVDKVVTCQGGLSTPDIWIAFNFYCSMIPRRVAANDAMCVRRSITDLDAVDVSHQNALLPLLPDGGGSIRFVRVSKSVNAHFVVFRTSSMASILQVFRDSVRYNL